MKQLAGVLMIATLSGCASQATLIAQDTGRYSLNIEPVGRKISTVIDGVAYAGSAVGDVSAAIGTSLIPGKKPEIIPTSSVTVGNSARVVLTAATGAYLECSYSQFGRNFAGDCVSNTGRKFVLATQ